MYNWVKLTGISIIIVGLLVLGGCEAKPSPTTLPSGSLQGVISDASTGSPIADAQVSIAGQVGVFTVMSDASGKYQVSALPPGAYLISVQAAGYYVNAAQIGIVPNVVSDGNVMLEPDAVSVVVVTATPSPAPSPTMTMTLEPTASATPTPKATATRRPTTTPRPTALSRSASMAARVLASPTSIPNPAPPPAMTTTATCRPSTNLPSTVRHSAPELREPLNGSVFKGPRRITFNWLGYCCALGPDEYYVVSIPHPWGVEEAWVKTNFWDAPLYLYLLVPESRQLTWSVSVRRHTGQYPNGQWTGPIVSQISETWYFTWLAQEGELGSPLSPLPAP